MSASAVEAKTAAGEARLLGFERREVGSAEQLFLSKMPGGHLITTHCFVAEVEGDVDPQRLREALAWSIVKHPMLRAALESPVVDPEVKEEASPLIRPGAKTNGRWTWTPTPLSVEEIVDRALTVEEVAGGDALGKAWQLAFEKSLDASTFDFENGPLWSLKLLRSKGASALHFSFIHALDDQRSANQLVHELLTHMEAADRGEALAPPAPLPLAASIEDVLLLEELDAMKLAGYALSQLAHASMPVIAVPSSLRQEERTPRKNWGLSPTQPSALERPVQVPQVDTDGNHKLLLSRKVDPEAPIASENRRNIISVGALDADSLAALRIKCREENVTITMAVSVAGLLASSDVSNDERDLGYEAYRLLLGVDLRRFGPEGDWTKGSMAFASGALDLVLKMLPRSGGVYVEENTGEDPRSKIGGVPFWDLARACADFTQKWFDKGYAAESVRLFDMGTRFLQLEKIITLTADDPNTVGRAYTLTVSNAGVYVPGSSDGAYGSRTLKSLHFGISQAVSGSMLAASTVTVAGKMFITAHAASPVVSRLDLDGFSNRMVEVLTLAARAPARKTSGTPRVDYPVDVRGGLPWFYPLETPKDKLVCPVYEDIKSPTMPFFEVDKYVGIWYELAFHDITQANMCGCTQFNMTRYGNVIEDMFTVTCPWPWRSGIDGPWLPGISKVTGHRKGNQWTCNMTMFYQPERLGVMRETGFGQEFDNMILEVWRDPEIQAKTGYEYTRAIQFQCVSVGTGADQKITFTGINFLSRVPILSTKQLQEMFVRARALGLEPYGSNDMHIVEHEGCRYPVRTDAEWMGDRPEWPAPILGKEFGAQV